MRIVIICVLVVASFGAAVPAFGAQATQVACSDQASANTCDTDRDRIANTIEVAICGSSTCATGVEDADSDGIPDWSEVAVCGSTRCADPTADLDDDGIPDFAEQFVCGNQTCATALEDADGDKIGDWVEFVICGDRSCANGREDYDGDGVSDAIELAACVKWVGNSGPGSVNPLGVAYFVTPGGVVTEVLIWPLYAAVGLVLLFVVGLLVWWLLRRRHRARKNMNASPYARSNGASDVTSPLA